MLFPKTLELDRPHRQDEAEIKFSYMTGSPPIDSCFVGFPKGNPAFPGCPGYCLVEIHISF